jgi:hypothetical protein
VNYGSDVDVENSHEGWWEYGSFKPKKQLTEESRQARLQIWSQR